MTPSTTTHATTVHSRSGLRAGENTMKNATTIRRRISMSPLRLGPLLLLPLLSACGVQGATEGVADEREESPGAVGSPQEADPRQTVGEEDHQEGEAAEGEDHLGEIHLGTEQAESFGVRVEALQAGSARSTLSRPVTLLLNPDRKALVGPRLEAKVVRVTADLGDRVRAGDTLAILSSVELGRAKSGFLTARARFHTAETTYRREQTLYEREISSEAELLEAEARFREGRAELNAAREALRLYGLTLEEIEGVEAGSQVPLSYFPLRSPVAGRVQHRDLSPGQTVGPDETPIHVAGVEELWAMVEAFSRDAPLLETGSTVNVQVRGIPDRTFRGTLDWVSYELEPATRTLRARAVIDNPEGSLRAGMFGTARLDLPTEIRYAMVPVDAVQTLEDGSVVFVPADEPGAFRPVPVRLGEESQEGWVEIVSGLEPGDRAVVAGAFDLMSAATAATRSASHGH